MADPKSDAVVSPAREILIGIVVAALILGAWHKMVRSSTYNSEPRWIRWAWAIFYVLLALGTGLFALSLPA